MRKIAKGIFVAIARLLALPAACLAGFGRWREPFDFFANAFALVPGMPGSYLRVAYYTMTLRSVGANCHIGFGAYFSHPGASLGNGAGVGSYSIIGRASIGDGTLLASHVQIPSGTKQHRRDEEGRLTDEGRAFHPISIGANCWLGASCIVMADVGDKCTIGAGAVVTKPVPPGATVFGNPAMPR